MNYSQLSKYLKSRFNKARVCPECGGVIFDQDEFIMQVKTIRKNKFYIFSHERCVTNEQIVQKTKDSAVWV